MSVAVVGDTLTEIEFELVDDDGVPVDLTDYVTITFTANYQIDVGALRTVSLSLVSPFSSGLVKFRPVAGDLYAAGMAHGRVYAASGGALVGKSLRFSFPVEADPYAA